MKLMCASLILLLVLFVFPQDVVAETVRVRLGQSSSPIELTGSAIQFQTQEQPYHLVAIPQNSSIKIHSRDLGGKRVWTVRLNNKDTESMWAEKYLLIKGENLRWGAKKLPSHVLLNLNEKQNVDIIGLFPIEDYLVGVLASEMPLSWPLETLKAQAVASRSYTLALIEERRDQPFHLEGNFLNQSFRYILSDEKESPQIVKALRAIRETENVTLLSANDKVLKAFFHSDCGGQTTTPQNVWNSGVNTGSVIDKSCPTNPAGRWTLSLESSELEQRLHLSRIKEFQMEKIPNEKRVASVRVALHDGGFKEFSVNSLRQLVGFQELKSSMFELKKIGEKFIFSGVGLGHGVGLCQWGSRTLGMQGYDYKKILSHYYPLAQIKNQKTLAL